MNLRGLASKHKKQKKKIHQSNKNHAGLQASVKNKNQNSPIKKHAGTGGRVGDKGGRVGDMGGRVGREQRNWSATFRKSLSFIFIFKFSQK